MFDDRKKHAEKKFELDAEKKFKVTALRNKYLGIWAAEKIGLSKENHEDYAKEVILADFKESGDQDVIDKIMYDFKEKNISINEDVIKDKINHFYNEALKNFKEE
tara:strand:- start:4 stop:318 length:315 start_codon:yes stop_codon:yes gene_type:complete